MAAVVTSAEAAPLMLLPLLGPPDSEVVTHELESTLQRVPRDARVQRLRPAAVRRHCLSVIVVRRRRPQRSQRFISGQHIR